MPPLLALSFACSAHRIEVEPMSSRPLVEAAPVQTALSAPQGTPEAAPSASEAPEQAPALGATYALRRGETLEHFARWSGLPVEVLAQLSGLSLEAAALPVGTPVQVPLEADGLARLEVAREAHHLERSWGWLSSRGGAVGTEAHEVRDGETAWTIAKTHGDVPVWVVEAYNPEIDLDALEPGRALLIPLVADGVVEAHLHD